MPPSKGASLPPAASQGLGDTGRVLGGRETGSVRGTEMRKEQKVPGLCGSQQGPYQDLLGKLVTANPSKHPCSPHAQSPGVGVGG